MPTEMKQRNIIRELLARKKLHKIDGLKDAEIVNYVFKACRDGSLEGMK
jgi:hypothetical protein